MNSEIGAIVLAAGHGTRMKSSLTKVLHEVGGEPMVYYPLQAALGAGVTRLSLVVGPHNEDALREFVSLRHWDDRIELALQRQARGTGDAARAGLSGLSEDCDSVLILCGDTPLITSDDLRSLIRRSEEEESVALWVMTCLLDDPSGYGRIIKNERGEVVEIREQKELRSAVEEANREINSGVYLVKRSFLEAALGALTPNNAQGEYYLTDVVAHAANHGGARSVLSDPDASRGVNDLVQLNELEQRLFDRSATALRRAGARIAGDAEIGPSVVVEPDARVDAGARLRGSTFVSSGSKVGVGCVLRNVHVAAGANIGAYSLLEDVVVPAKENLPPFSIQAAPSGGDGQK